MRANSLIWDVQKDVHESMYICIYPPLTRATPAERGGLVVLLSAAGHIAERHLLRKPTSIRGKSGLGIGNLNPVTVQAGNVGKPQQWHQAGADANTKFQLMAQPWRSHGAAEKCSMGALGRSAG